MSILLNLRHFIECECNYGSLSLLLKGVNNNLGENNNSVKMGGKKEATKLSINKRTKI